MENDQKQEQTTHFNIDFIRKDWPYIIIILVLLLGVIYDLTHVGNIVEKCQDTYESWIKTNCKQAQQSWEVPYGNQTESQNT